MCNNFRRLRLKVVFSTFYLNCSINFLSELFKQKRTRRKVKKENFNFDYLKLLHGAPNLNPLSLNISNQFCIISLFLFKNLLFFYFNYPLLQNTTNLIKIILNFCFHLQTTKPFSPPPLPSLNATIYFSSTTKQKHPSTSTIKNTQATQHKEKLSSFNHTHTHVRAILDEITTKPPTPTHPHTSSKLPPSPTQTHPH